MLYVFGVRVPSEIDKYKKTATVTKTINNLMSNMTNSQFNYFSYKLRDISSEIVGEPVLLQGSIVESSRSNDAEITSASREHRENIPAQSSVPGSSTSIFHLEQHPLQRHNQLLSAPMTSYQENQNGGAMNQVSSIDTRNQLLSAPVTSYQENQNGRAIDQVSSVETRLTQDALHFCQLDTFLSDKKILFEHQNRVFINEKLFPNHNCLLCLHHQFRIVWWTIKLRVCPNQFSPVPWLIFNV